MFMTPLRRKVVWAEIGYARLVAFLCQSRIFKSNVRHMQRNADTLNSQSLDFSLAIDPSSRPKQNTSRDGSENAGGSASAFVLQRRLMLTGDVQAYCDLDWKATGPVMTMICLADRLQPSSADEENKMRASPVMQCLDVAFLP